MHTESIRICVPQIRCAQGINAHAHRRRCRSALSVRSLAKNLAHLFSICGMHTASDSTRRSRYTTRWFSTCANILLYAHRERSDLRGVNSTLSLCLGLYTIRLIHKIAISNSERGYRCKVKIIKMARCWLSTCNKDWRHTKMIKKANS